MRKSQLYQLTCGTSGEGVQAHRGARLPELAIRNSLEGKLWEVRISASSGISRAIYVTATGQRAVIVRVFVKKTQKTPQRELELARQRALEVT